jgi:hypothetical protein
MVITEIAIVISQIPDGDHRRVGDCRPGPAQATGPQARDKTREKETTSRLAGDFVALSDSPCATHAIFLRTKCELGLSNRQKLGLCRLGRPRQKDLGDRFLI